MFIILSLLVLGMGIGYLFRCKGRSIDTSRTSAVTIAVLIFIFGIGIGSNKEIIENIDNIGVPAIVISLLGIIGSLIAACGYDYIFRKKGGLK